MHLHGECCCNLFLLFSSCPHPPPEKKYPGRHNDLSQRLDFQKMSMSKSLFLAVPLVGFSSFFSSVSPPPTSADCSWQLNTVVVPVHCAGGNNTCGDGSSCCTHEHQLMTYNQVVDMGFETGMTPRGTGSPVKKYYGVNNYICDDYYHDSETPTTCGWPFPGVSTDGPGSGSGANHYVWDWSLTSCD